MLRAARGRDGSRDPAPVSFRFGLHRGWLPGLPPGGGPAAAGRREGARAPGYYAVAATRSGAEAKCPMAKSFFPQTSLPRASQIGRSAKLEG